VALTFFFFQSKRRVRPTHLLIRITRPNNQLGSPPPLLSSIKYHLANFLALASVAWVKCRVGRIGALFNELRY
jgi:hypothetical protein